MNRKSLLIPFISIAVFLATINVHGQSNILPYGTPMIFNYTARDYLAAPENFSIVQNKHGIIYFGNIGYVLEYDGVEWRKIEIKKNVPVLSLAVDSLNTVYVSSGNEFGFLKPDVSGELKYISLSKELGLPDAFVEGSGKVLVSSKSVYFQTSGSLVIFPNYITFNQKNNRVIVPKPFIIKAETAFNNSFIADDIVFVDQKNSGLSQLFGNELKPVKKKNFLKWKVIAILPYTADRVVVCSEKGIYFYKYNQGFMNFDSETDYYLDEISILSAAILPEMFVFATLNKGTIVIDRKISGKKRRIIEQYNKIAGLPTEQINCIYNNQYYDNNLLWLTSAYGISKTQLNSTIRKINEASDVKDIITGIIRNDKTLYVRTLGQVYYMKDTLDTHQFLKINKITSTSDWITFPVEVTQESKDKKKKKFFKIFSKKYKPPTRIEQKIVLASKNGLQLIDGNEVNMLKPDMKVLYNPKSKKQNYALLKVNKSFPKDINKLYRSKKDKFRIFLAMNNGVNIISYQHGKWIDEGFVDGISENINGINEDTLGNVWLSDNSGNLTVIRNPDTLIVYNTPPEYGNKKDSISYF